MRFKLAVFSVVLVLSFLSSAVFAGKIVVNHDEWTLSNTGFANSPDAGIFVDNVAQFFTGGGPGTFHGYSTNFGLSQSDLANAFIGAGHTYTTGTAISFDVPTLLGFDGIFVAGDALGLDTNVLVDYVNAGGNVYLAGGTGGPGGAVGEAAFWNAFLNPFGLAFTSPYNGVGGSLSVQPAPHAIFNGVSTLYQNNGNTISDINGPNATVYFDGLYAVYDDSANAVPEPTTMGLLGLGFLALWFRRRRD